MYSRSVCVDYQMELILEQLRTAINIDPRKGSLELVFSKSHNKGDLEHACRVLRREGYEFIITNNKSPQGWKVRLTWNVKSQSELPTHGIERSDGQAGE